MNDEGLLPRLIEHAREIVPCSTNPALVVCRAVVAMPWLATPEERIAWLFSEVERLALAATEVRS